MCVCAESGTMTQFPLPQSVWVGRQSEDRFTFALMKTKHPGHVIVFVVVISNGNIMLSFRFPQIQHGGLH